MTVNGFGATATRITLVVVLVAEGAWITAILIPALILIMSAVKRHYDRVRSETVVDRPLRIDNLTEPLVIVPLERWTRIAEKGLRFALKLSNHVQAVHVDAEDCCEEVKTMWQRNVLIPFDLAHNAPPGDDHAYRTVPELVLLPSPYRYILMALVEHILQVEHDNPDRQIAVLVPELVVKHWWQNFLHNQRAQVLKVLLLLRGNQRIVINIPWYLAVRRTAAVLAAADRRDAGPVQ